MTKRDTTREEATVARVLVLARLAEARAAVACALESIDGAILHFVMPDEDKTGDEREELIHEADDWLGEAAKAVQAAEEVLPGIDPGEGTPEYEDEDDEEDGDDEGADEEATEED